MRVYFCGHFHFKSTYMPDLVQNKNKHRNVSKHQLTPRLFNTKRREATVAVGSSRLMKRVKHGRLKSGTIWRGYDVNKAQALPLEVEQTLAQ